MSPINIIVGILIWIAIYTIVSRICECFERCSMTKAFKDAKEFNELYDTKNKVTVDDLYPKEK